MTDLTDDDEETLHSKKKTEDSGEGDSDSWGRGKAGAGSGVSRARRNLSPQRLKEVMADWRQLDVAALVQAVAEFFVEMPMRASANLRVAWKQTRANAKSFAVVNWLISFGEKAGHDLILKASGPSVEKTTTGGGGKSGGRGLKRGLSAPNVVTSPKPSGF